MKEVVIRLNNDAVMVLTIPAEATVEQILEHAAAHARMAAENRAKSAS